MAGLPTSWTEILGRLARVLGGDDTRDAEEWVRGAVEARWGTSTLRDLDRVQRQLAFQKTSGALLRLEEEGLPDELVAPDLPRVLMYRDGSLEPADGYPGRRGQIAAAFARYFDGVAVEGPPWRLTPLEAERPTYREYAASADFV